MLTVNEQLRDEAVRQAVDFTRYGNGVVRRLIAILNRVDADLMAQISVAIESLTAETFTTDRLENLLHGVRVLNWQAFAAIERELGSELRELVAYEVGHQFALFESVLPPQVVASVGIAPVDAGQVYAAAMARPFQGVLLREALAGVGEGRARAIRDAVRVGFIENEATGAVIKRIRGSRVNGYADGLLEAPRRHIEAIVRTALQHTASFARDKFFEANGGLIAAVVWSSTLDLRTSDLCRARDGKRYTADTHKPVGHKLPWLGGPGRAHWNCRSAAVPVTKSWAELGIDIEEMSPGTRASMDGQVPEETTYSEWLTRQSAARQDDVLGPTRGKLLRSGGLTIEKFSNDKGRMLTLAQLRQRSPKAFQAAGL